MVEITDKWLNEMGGWQAMKTARALWSAGAVSAAEFDGTRLTGTVRDQGKSFPSGLLIKGRSDVETLCTCYVAKRDGFLCGHALAVGAAWIRRGEKPPVSAVSSANSPGNTSSARGPVASGNTQQTPAPPPVSPAMAKGALTFVFAGNFFEGLRRQKLSVMVETGSPDDAAQAADLPVLIWLGALMQKTVPPHLMLSTERQVTDFMNAVAGHPRLILKNGAQKTPLRLPLEPARLTLQITAAPDASAVKLTLQPPPEKAEIFPPESTERSGWLWQSTAARLQPLRAPSTAAFEVLKTLPPAGRPLEKPRRWLAQHLAALQEAFAFDAEFSAPGLLRFRLAPGMPKFELTLEGTLERLGARLLCRYEGLGAPPPFPPGVPETPGFPLETPGLPDVFQTRNLPAEAAALQRLQNCGFEPTGGEGSSELLLKGESAILQFFAGELDRLKAIWNVKMGTRFTAATVKVERLAPQWKPVSAGNDWLAFDLSFASAGGTVLNQGEIARLLATGSGHKKMPNGRTAVISLTDAMDLSEVLRDVRPDQQSGHFRVKKLQLGYLEQTFGKPLPSGESAPSWPLKSAAPLELLTILRDYQKTGVQWLLDHTAQGLGGILADEMGLGKTLQSLTLISALRKRFPDRPALVVCPKSLLGNWQAEAERFLPDLKVLRLDGTQRKGRFDDIKGAGLVLTSYQLLARDIEHHQSIEWSAAILDEAGFIRNPDTQAAKAARLLQAGARFALTGTPVENGVRDLWSLMEFAVPGYLGPQKEFQERYEAPLTAGGTGAAPLMARLRRRMAPYILRRLKQDVAKDLPSKIEKIQPCELTAVQRELYAGLLREGASKVVDAENAKQTGQARMHMLTALLRLRQTCCDPRLLPIDLPKKGKTETAPAELSGKMEALTELLEEIREGGHSVIIFSAFASMLRLIRETVEAADLQYCYLDGQTRDRAAQVNAFQNDPDKRVFLISLKAGGFGLNLTKADTVIHYDPWWNPAVEAQATDRAHRIGQSRPVTVYKLITTGTVEEKILKLQQKKRGLMDAALDDEAPLMESLTDEDLRELLR